MTDNGIMAENNEAAQQFEVHVDGLHSLLAYKRNGGWRSLVVQALGA